MKTDLPAADMPNVFENTSHLVCEIGHALRKSWQITMQIEAERATRSLDGMNRAHIELDKLLGQSRLLSESLGRVIQFHVNRRKAQS